MQEARKTICPADTEREAHACVSSESYQTREVCVSGYQNAELKKLALLRLHLPDAMFSNAMSAFLLIDTRPASLQQNVGLIKSVFLKCR